MMRCLVGLYICSWLSLMPAIAAADVATRGVPTEIMQDGMYVLGAWSVLNIGSALVLQRRGANRHFDQMNGMWNLVNLGIVGATLGLGAPEAELANKIFALNVGLDVAYLATAAYLRERSKNVETVSQKERFSGYANAIALQGAFLLIFDIVMWWQIERWQDVQLGFIPSQEGLSLAVDWAIR